MDRIYLKLPHRDSLGYLVFPVFLDGNLMTLKHSDGEAISYAERLAKELGCTYDIETE